MKKLSFLLSLLILLSAFTCENEPLDEDISIPDTNASCEEAMMNSATAAQNFATLTEENYEENYAGVCSALRTALEAQLAACGDPDGSLQSAIEALGTCDLNANPCEVATSSAAIAEQVYNQATEEEFTDACNAYVFVLQQKINECGDEDGSLQAIIDGLDCSGGGEPSNSIVGTWLLTAWNSSETFDINNDGTSSINLLDEMDCYTNETIVFNADGTAVNTSTSYADFSMEIIIGTEDSYEYSMNCVQETEISNVTWVQNGNAVTITDESGSASDWILDGNQLSTFVPEGFSVSNEDYTVTTTADLTFVYTKQ